MHTRSLLLLLLLLREGWERGQSQWRRRDGTHKKRWNMRTNAGTVH